MPGGFSGFGRSPILPETLQFPSSDWTLRFGFARMSSLILVNLVSSPRADVGSAASGHELLLLIHRLLSSLLRFTCRGIAASWPGENSFFEPAVTAVSRLRESRRRLESFLGRCASGLELSVLERCIASPVLCPASCICTMPNVRRGGSDSCIAVASTFLPRGLDRGLLGRHGRFGDDLTTSRLCSYSRAQTLGISGWERCRCRRGPFAAPWREWESRRSPSPCRVRGSGCRRPQR